MSENCSNLTPPPNVPDVTEPNDDQFKKNGLRQEFTTEALARLQQNIVKVVDLMGVPIIALVIDNQERLCLAQISNTLLKQYSYNEVHNRRVALGINCVQCTPVQLEILRRAGAMPVSSRRCGMITKREAERLCKSFLSEAAPPKLPDDFSFHVCHKCAWGCKGVFAPSRYNSSRAKCIQCDHCRIYFSPNKFIFHSHRFADSSYTQPDAANFNNWRRHLHLVDKSSETLSAAWEDVKAMFNGGTRKRFLTAAISNACAPPSEPHCDDAPPIKQFASGKQSTLSMPFTPPSFGSSFSAVKPSSMDPRPAWFFNPYAAAALSGGFQANRFFPATFPMLTQTQFMTNPMSLLASEMVHNGTDLSSFAPQVREARNDSTSGTPPKRITGFLEGSPLGGGDVDAEKKQYHTMNKEELQEMLFNEMEARKRLEQDLVVLKGEKCIRY